jgi:hypothetical protein
MLYLLTLHMHDFALAASLAAATVFVITSTIKEKRHERKRA